MRTEREPTEARQGRKTGVVRWVLVLSLGGAAVLLALIYFWFVNNPTGA
jgi:hypothetical protein